MMKQQPRFEAKFYYNLSLDRLVPEDHLLRLIANAVDFSFIRPLCRPFYSHTGRPSVDPVVLFKMLLIGYLYGITSERRLARELSLNLGYRWFLGYDFDQPTPDHSVLSKARARFGPEVFETFFRRSIDLCRDAGLLEEGPVYVDSTLIQASAAVDSMVRKEDRAQPPLSIEEYVQRLYTENEPAPEDEEPPPPGPGLVPRAASSRSKGAGQAESGTPEQDGPRSYTCQPAGVRPPSRLQGACGGVRSPRPGDHGGHSDNWSRGGRAPAR